jgi:hypothetical protein
MVINVTMRAEAMMGSESLSARRFSRAIPCDKDAAPDLFVRPDVRDHESGPATIDDNLVWPVPRWHCARMRVDLAHDNQICGLCQVHQCREVRPIQTVPFSTVFNAPDTIAKAAFEELSLIARRRVFPEGRGDQL